MHDACIWIRMSKLAGRQGDRFVLFFFINYYRVLSGFLATA
jgi:hypothetical protein